MRMLQNSTFDVWAHDISNLTASSVFTNKVIKTSGRLHIFKQHLFSSLPPRRGALVVVVVVVIILVVVEVLVMVLVVVVVVVVAVVFLRHKPSLILQAPLLMRIDRRAHFLRKQKSAFPSCALQRAVRNPWFWPRLQRCSERVQSSMELELHQACVNSNSYVRDAVEF